MGLFNKHDKVPKIPQALRLPELPKNLQNRNNNQLPTLPNTNFGENLNQEMVKSAVTDTSEEKQGNMESLPQNFKYQPQNQNSGQIPSPQEMPPQAPQEIPSQNPVLEAPQNPVPQPPIPENPQPSIPKAPQPQMQEHKKPEMHQSIMENEEKRTLELAPNNPRLYPTNAKEIEPIFVRIDKFQDSQKKFEDVKKDVNEIEKVLRKVKEAKIKEDTEISEWSNDLEKIKARLAEIDSNIFDQV